MSKLLGVIGLPVKNYNAMLNQVGLVSGLVAALLGWMLSDTVAWLSQPPVININIYEVPLPYQYAVLFLGAFVLTRIVKLHDRISNLFGIRVGFDVESILVPLGMECGLVIKSEHHQVLKTHRHKLMRSCFYKYASSTDPKIDAHEIEQALEAWALFWMLLEACLYFVAAGLISWKFGGMQGVALSFALAFASCVGCVLQLRTCKARAISEVTAIAADVERRESIEGEFSDVLR